VLFFWGVNECVLIYGRIAFFYRWVWGLKKGEKIAYVIRKRSLRQEVGEVHFRFASISLSNRNDLISKGVSRLSCAFTTQFFLMRYPTRCHPSSSEFLSSEDQTIRDHKSSSSDQQAVARKFRVGIMKLYSSVAKICCKQICFTGR